MDLANSPMKSGDSDEGASAGVLQPCALVFVGNGSGPASSDGKPGTGPSPEEVNDEATPELSDRRFRPPRSYSCSSRALRRPGPSGVHRACLSRGRSTTSDRPDRFGHGRAHPGDRFEIDVTVRGKDAEPDLIRLSQKDGSDGYLWIRFPTDRGRTTSTLSSGIRAARSRRRADRASRGAWAPGSSGAGAG